jgi:hypothetical protein
VAVVVAEPVSVAEAVEVVAAEVVVAEVAVVAEAVAPAQLSMQVLRKAKRRSLSRRPRLWRGSRDDPQRYCLLPLLHPLLHLLRR